jgi:phenylacetate-coenzyme A ligase PaaK-like adenylate-forming protein
VELSSELMACIGRCDLADEEFNRIALEGFTTQFDAIPIYRQVCERRNLTPGDVKHWTRIPSLPTSAFKEFEISSIPSSERTAVFYSSGTTCENRSRHFHHAQSLGIYEASLRAWFERNFRPSASMKLVFLTPEDVPNSSLVHMFKTVRRTESLFTGRLNADDSWSVDTEQTLAALESGQPIGLLGTAFSFVHLLDHLEATGKRLSLAPGSRVMETGGYKGRSREMPKVQLHRMISKFLGVARTDIVTEYGMSELSSQAYDRAGIFHFPPWARAQVVSPETGAEVADGETGLLRVFDLANIWSVMAVQTEDLAARRGNGFELLGRAPQSEPRGCSLMPELRNGR